MRDDMSKVVIERPRYGHSLPNGKTRLRVRRFNYELDYNEDFDDLMDGLPKRVSGSRSKYLREEMTKSFTDLLSPLYRFLCSNVGRPWDAVYSEMSEHLDNRKATGRHIFEHAEDMVTVNCYEEGCVVYENNCWGGRPAQVEGLYVHPRTGLLCLSPVNRQKRPKENEEVVRILIGRGRHYIKQNGIWFIAELKYGHATNESERSLPIFNDHNRRPWLILRKKQCNTKELKRAGLKNSPVA